MKLGRVGLNPIIGIFSRERGGIITDTEKMSCERGGRTGLRAATSQGMLGPAGAATEAYDELCLGASNRNEPCQHQEFGIRASRTVGQYARVILSPSVCSCLFQQPQESNTAPKEQTELTRPRSGKEGSGQRKTAGAKGRRGGTRGPAKGHEGQ